MEESKRKAQSEYQKKYDKKTKNLSFKYTLHEMEEYEQLKEYLDETGVSLNTLVKNLIRNHVINKKSDLEPDADRDRTSDQGKYWIFQDFSEEVAERLYQEFDRETAHKILDIYEEEMDRYIYTLTSDSSLNLEQWVEDIIERKKEGELDELSPKELKKLLRNEISNCIEL